MLQPLWNDVKKIFFVLMIQQRKCKKKKKQCHISDKSPLVGKYSDQRVFICTFIAMYVFIGHVCWKWKRDEERKSCSCRWGALFFGGNEDWSDGCQRSLQEILNLKNPWGQIWPSPKWVTCSWPIDLRKHPESVFKCVYHHIRGRKQTFLEENQN